MLFITEDKGNKTVVVGVEEEEKGGVMVMEDAEGFWSFVKKEVVLEDIAIGLWVEEESKTVVVVVEEKGEEVVDGEDFLSFIMVELMDSAIGSSGEHIGVVEEDATTQL